MTTVLLTGSCGFIGGYVAEELLQRGFHVVGIDNYSKYGKVEKSYDSHPNYRFVEGDARDVKLMTVTPWPLYRAWRSARCGILPMHGGHQVAQKWTT